MTETLFDLGVGPELVGVTKYCVHPEVGLEHAARVGGTKNPDVDAIRRLAPDIVFCNREENRLEDALALEAAGLRVHTSMPERISDVPPMIREAGALVGREARAEELATRVERAALRAGEAARARGTKTSFLVLIWRKPWMAAGFPTFLSDLLATAGGVNVLSSKGAESTADARYPLIDLGEIRRLDPRRVLLPSEPYPFARRHVDELISGTRFREERFLRCDGELLTWHGSRTALGLDAASRWLA